MNPNMRFTKGSVYLNRNSYASNINENILGKLRKQSQVQVKN